MSQQPLKYILIIGPVIGAVTALLTIGAWVGISKSTAVANAASITELRADFTKHSDMQANHISDINTAISLIQRDLAVIATEVRLKNSCPGR